mmetsp:Transcript_29997/g.26569  ORF Transcript_29997/g.26569 Transcript_29997/m.26569 type:complete len:146 (-) Transcript_29997:891-1328(-)
MKTNLKRYSQREFRGMIDKGRQLCLFNNYIIDIEPFANQHPGNKFVLTHNIGNDIGKYFYGSYSMEAEVQPYAHSSYAGDVLEKLIIGEIRISLNNSSWNYENSGRKSLLESKRKTTITNEIMKPLESENFTFTIRKKDELSPNV